jgi:putative tryptophan/tyrosine transport system substrate-binding protein
VKRREFITFLGGAVAAWPLAPRAQQAPMPVIGYLSARSAESDVPMLAAFRRGLNETGYVTDQNVVIEFRFADGRYDRLPALAEDLVTRQVAVIVTGGGEGAALAAKAATASIPIVFNVGEDPVRFGLVTSLNRPGGNITGVTSLLAGLGTKQLGLLRELVPNADVVAMLVNPNDPWAASETSDIQSAAHSVGQHLTVLKASTELDIDAAYARLIQQRAAAVLVAASPLFVTRAEQLIGLSARHALPTIYHRREMALAGGLMSYGSSTAEAYGQMGVYAGKILRGIKPADLPVQQPTKFELIINLKTAKALGLEIPPTLLARADEVIE